jgi:hypothetical protein
VLCDLQVEVRCGECSGILYGAPQLQNASQYSSNGSRCCSECSDDAGLAGIASLPVNQDRLLRLGKGWQEQLTEQIGLGQGPSPAAVLEQLQQLLPQPLQQLGALI